MLTTLILSAWFAESKEKKWQHTSELSVLAHPTGLGLDVRGICDLGFVPPFCVRGGSLVWWFRKAIQRVDESPSFGTRDQLATEVAFAASKLWSHGQRVTSGQAR